MNWNQIESNWKQLKGSIQHQWAELTGNDLDNISGNSEELTSKIQQRYNLDRQRAEKEVGTWQNSQHDFEDDIDLDDNNLDNNSLDNNSLNNNGLDNNGLDNNGLDGNDVGGNSNTTHTNKFGYDETSSNQIQSGNDNNTMPGTNNLSAQKMPNNLDATLSVDGQPINGNISPDDSQGSADAGGVSGANDEDGIDDDIDEINNPTTNPLASEKTPPVESNNKTDHQEKSLDQT